MKPTQEDEAMRLLDAIQQAPTVAHKIHHAESALTLARSEATVAAVERCAKVAEAEPLPVGPIPTEFAPFTAEEVALAAIRSTKEAIAQAIRGSRG